MILYLFATLLEKRNRLIEKYKECGGNSIEILSNIHQVEMDIVKNKEFYFSHMEHGELRTTESRKKVLLYSHKLRNKFVPIKHIPYAVQ